VDVFHLEKRGNSIRILSSDRVPFDEVILDRYEAIRGTYRNPLFRGQLVRNLLKNRDWYAGFGMLFARRPWKQFLSTGTTNLLSDQFARDTYSKFNAAAREARREREGAMTSGEAAPDAELAERIHAMVRTYVMRKTEARCGISWDSFKDRRTQDKKLDVPKPYRDARRKVCMDAFLALRSRNAREDFVAYFTGTICSVPQFLPKEEYAAVAEALLSDRWEEARALAMLALSACSHV
jgi:CRISPR-associated protein Cmx8